MPEHHVFHSFPGQQSKYLAREQIACFPARYGQRSMHPLKYDLEIKKINEWNFKVRIIISEVKAVIFILCILALSKIIYGYVKF